jgi:hypothetical protein
MRFPRPVTLTKRFLVRIHRVGCLSLAADMDVAALTAGDRSSDEGFLRLLPNGRSPGQCWPLA